MTEETELFELINADIDGELTPELSQQLAAIRSERPEIATLYDETAAVAGMLLSMRTVEPPADMKDRILRALPPPSVSRAANQSRSPGFIDTILSVLRPQPRLRLAVAFAGGLVVGAVLLSIVPLLGRVDPGQSIGTIGAPAGTETTGPETSAQIQGESFQGIVKLRRDGARAVLELAGHSDEPSVIKFSFSPEQVTFRGVSDLSPDAIPGLSIEKGGVSASLSGNTALTITFDLVNAGKGRFHVSLTEGEAVTASKELSI